MEILLQLGANETAFIQFVLFILSISFLTIFIYGPFFKANDQRIKLTKGAEQVASETQEEAKKLEQIYQVRAREINQTISGVFEKSKQQANIEIEKIMAQAKDEAAVKTSGARLDIANQKTKAESSAKTITEEVASDLIKKLTGVTI